MSFFFSDKSIICIVNFIERRINIKKDFIYNVYYKEDGYDFCESMENILLNYIKKTINGNDDLFESLSIY